MNDVVMDILDVLRERESLDAAQLDRIVRTHSKRAHDGRRKFAKKHILPYYLQVKAENGPQWLSWNVDDELDARFVRTLKMKPRRTASGVATVTVITKPWPCANNCVYCPDDERMPKSYLSDEPACQRAERNEFDPYLQVTSRLHTLSQMGHATDKVELIVLGGTWFDYPRDYRLWFIGQLFSACNGSERTPEGNPPDSATLESLHKANEEAEHRVVGLVIETRPDTVTPENLREMRALGCTKIQLGVQSIDQGILKANGRRETPDTIRRALELSRLFGFKTHTHIMLNLLTATPETDKRDFRTFVTDKAYLPDEIKLYPCALVAGTQLVDCYQNGSWRPYSEEELLDVLCADMKATPAFTRVSRMIRDISAQDILVGNKKTNLRQLVEERLHAEQAPIAEIRYREIGTEEVDLSELTLDELVYETTATTEHFLQWLTPEGKIAGFLRLSLPHPDALQRYGSDVPIFPGEAMIREVHVYGFATRIDTSGASAQHHGLGRSLVERAAEIALDAGYNALNVISAIGTRAYYRKLGFADNGLYQQRKLL